MATSVIPSEGPQADYPAPEPSEPSALPPPPRMPFSGGQGLDGLLLRPPEAASLPKTPAYRETELARLPPPPPAVAGYEVLAELGHGGMGIVYKARQVALNRLVALKMIRTGSTARPEELVRFRAEAEAVARLQHPNIIQVHEVGEADGRPYLTLEYVDGGSLARRLAAAPLPPRQAAQLTRTLALAAHAAHQQGVIHRDLKPANVLLGGEGTAKITDFGLAKLLGEDTGQTQTGAVVGTPSYMAPEQARGALPEIGPATDVYALGAILYEMLTGRPPFRGATPLDTLDQVRGQEPVPPRQQQPRIPRDLETICLKCLQKQAARRYPSAEALADDVRRFLDGEPIRARPVGLRERAWKWARRRPVVAILTACCILTASALLGIGLFYHVQLQNALHTAERQRGRAERNNQKMLEAVDSLLTEVGVDQLRDLPEMEEVQRRLLEKALQIFAGRLEEEDDTDPVIRRETARAANRSAWINKLLGQMDRAEKDSRQALALCQGLVADFPDDPINRRELASAFFVHGDICSALGNKAEAVAANRQSKALREALPLDQPPDRLALASNCLNLAVWSQDDEEAQKLFQQGIDLAEKDGPGGRPKHAASLLSLIHLNLGVLHANHGRREAALAATEKARVYGETALREANWPDEARFHLGRVYHNLAALRRGPGDRKDVEELFGKALDLLQQVADRHPRVPSYAYEVVSTHEGLAEQYVNTARWAQAEGHLRKAVAIRRAFAGTQGVAELYAGGLARNYAVLGMVQQKQDNLKEARDSYTQAIALLEALQRQGPLVAPDRLVLLTSYAGRADLWIQGLGKYLENVLQGRPPAKNEGK